MKSINILIILILLPISFYPQNLVLNGSIELLEVNCILHRTGFFGTSNKPKAKFIYSLKNSPDILNRCAPFNLSMHYDSLVGVPKSRFGYQETRTGNNMICNWHFFNYQLSSYKFGLEITTFKINNNLIHSNNKYVLTFFVNNCNRNGFKTDIYSAIISSDSTFINTDSISYTNIISNPKGHFIQDTLNWRKITDTISLIGNERFIHLGKFREANSSNVKPFNPDGDNLIIIYLDDVSLTPIDTIPPKSNAGNDTIICFGDSVLIGGHNYADYFYTWWNKDSIIQRDKHIGKIWVKPDTNTWYYCRATDFRYDKTVDSIFVQVYPCKAANYNSTICKGDTAGLGNGKEGFYNFTWNPDYFIDDIHSNTPIANPPQTTMYYANYEDSLGRTLNDSILIEVINCDIPQIVNVYPVPTLNKITFEFNLPIPENTQIEIYDLSGKLINFYTFDKYSNKRKAVVDLYKLEAGVYFYKIKYKQRVLFRDKLIKL